MAVSYTSKMFVRSIPGFQAVVEEVLGIVVEPQPEVNIIKLFTAISCKKLECLSLASLSGLV